MDKGAESDTRKYGSDTIVEGRLRTRFETFASGLVGCSKEKTFKSLWTSFKYVK
ncbi:hypothetical protein GCM10019991_09640 [Enterococcus casseliflavus]